MNQRPTYLITIIFLVFYLTFSATRGQQITGYEIYPEYPSNTDEVFLVIHGSFDFLDCRLDSIHEFYACGAYACDGFYGTSFTPGDCSCSDTISMGILPNGPCLITYRMYYLGWSQVDQIDTFITVGTTGIEHLAMAGPEKMLIAPNPSRGQFSVRQIPENTDRIHIHNTAGTLVYEHISDEFAVLDNLSVSLPAGTYICTAYRDHIPITRRKVIVLE